MFNFLKKAMPAVDVADVLWTLVRDGSTARSVAACAFADGSSPTAEAVDEAVYFLSFAIDRTIQRVFADDKKLQDALCVAFLARVGRYAVAQRCPPCPRGDWLREDSNIWEPHSRVADDGDSIQHLSDRFDLYGSSMRRSAERSLPAAGILCALCNTLDSAFAMRATMAFIDTSRLTQDTLRSTRIAA